MAQHMHGKPSMEMNHIASQINSLPVAPAAEPQKREIIGKLNELASQMKHWAAQVEGFASMLNTFSILPGQGPPENVRYATRGAPPNGHAGYPPYPNPSQQQQHANSQHYQFHVQQYQPSSRRSDGLAANTSSYPPSVAHSQPTESSPPMPPTPNLDSNEKPGKRRRKGDPQRRKKDPLAPKRPPSAYILYQNDVRKQMQDKYPNTPYTEVLGKISESWQTLEEAKKKVYLDMVERDKVRYEDEKLRYNMGQDIPTKPTPRRPLSSLRAPYDPDAEVYAELEAEIEPEPEDAEEEIEGAEQDDQEPDAKRTRLNGTEKVDEETQANPLVSYQQPQPLSQELQTPSQTARGYPQPQTPVQLAAPVGMHPPAPTQHLQPRGHLQPYPHARPPSQASQVSHPSPSPSLQTQQSPQLAHVSPQLAHTSPLLSLQRPHYQAQHGAVNPGMGVGVQNREAAPEGGIQPSQS